MLKRTLKSLVAKRLKSFPALALLGPRQCGKTTLAKGLPGAYFDLEDPGDRTRLDAGWERLSKGPHMLILDEAQAFPEIFPRLRSSIDSQRSKNGRFLLLGSVSPVLMLQVSESLAGRLGILDMGPLTLEEAGKQKLEELWLKGGYPDGLLRRGAFPAWHQSYLRLLVERDLPNWGLPSRPQETMRLAQMLAASQGQVWNASDLGRSMGLSHNTVNTRVDFMEGAFHLRRLQPYFINATKRLSKRPRIYWRDSGLLHALMGIHGQQELLRQPWVGASWEGFVIEQIIGSLKSRGKQHQAYYYRSSDGYEIDLLLQTASARIAIEIKLSSAPAPEDLGRLRKAAALAGAGKRLLISRSRRIALESDEASADLSSAITWINRQITE
jgi:predicted AAA+ superfamily ATPase